MRIAVAYIDPQTGRALCSEAECEPGSTVREVALAAGAPVTDSSEFAVWNERVEAERIVSEGERVELLSPIRVDPKLARSLRAQNARLAPKRNIARHGGRHQLHL